MDKERIIKEAQKIAYENVWNYWGCAQSTFAAILETLRREDIHLTSKEAEKEIIKSLVGLSGGTGNCGWGSCGAIVGAAAAISLASGIGREKQLEDKDYRWIAFDHVANTIGKKFMDEFGGLRCRDVTWKRFGKWWDSWNPEAKAEFSREEKERGCLDIGKCTISMAAGWGVEYILDILDDPLTLEEVKAEHS